MEKKKKILIIDDENDFVELAAMYLGKVGYEVVSAPDGFKAMVRARITRPDVILLDYQLPGKNGLEIFREIKNDTMLGSTPVIIISARDENTQIRGEAAQLGADGYLSKPLDHQALLALIDGILARQKEISIVVADDEHEITELMSMRLGIHGYKVSVAHDGEEALALLRREKPDLLLLDLMMPNKDGWQVMQELRRDPMFLDLPVILFSARVKEMEGESWKKTGANDFIIKPFNPEELLAKIERLLSEKR